MQDRCPSAEHQYLTTAERSKNLLGNKLVVLINFHQFNETRDETRRNKKHIDILAPASIITLRSESESPLDDYL